MKTIPLALTSLLALSMSAGAWAMPPASQPIKAPLEGMKPPAIEATPKGVTPAVWRQHVYDESSLKLNGPNDGKPLTKLQLQQQKLDAITRGPSGQPGTGAVVGKGLVIKGVGEIADNGTMKPVILRLQPEKVMLPGGAEVRAYRLADGNLYYKDPASGAPTKIGFAAPETARAPAPVNASAPDIPNAKSLGSWINEKITTKFFGIDENMVARSEFANHDPPAGTPATVSARYNEYLGELEKTKRFVPGATIDLLRFDTKGETFWGVRYVSWYSGKGRMDVFDGKGAMVGLGAQKDNSKEYNWQMKD